MKKENHKPILSHKANGHIQHIKIKNINDKRNPIYNLQTYKKGNNNIK